MSKRIENQITYAAELKAAHLLQIEALTKPGLSPEQRVRAFAAAARFSWLDTQCLLQVLAYKGWGVSRVTPAYRVWGLGNSPWSIFGNLPDTMCCPVMEVHQGKVHNGIPPKVDYEWDPPREVLEAFARVQQERRLGDLAWASYSG